MKPRKDRIIFASELNTHDLKKMVFEQQNLLDIAISLSSNLKFESLIESILFICIGQLVIDKIAIFINTDFNNRNLNLYMQRSYCFDENLVIDSRSGIFKKLRDYGEVLTFDEVLLIEDLNEFDDFLISLKPIIIMPLKSKDSLNGIIIIGERLLHGSTSVDEISFLTYISKFASIAVENSRLYQMATTDRMSGLFIHHYFHERLAEEVNKSERHGNDLVLVLMDIDHFKNVNDKYGHMCGDMVIKTLSSIIKENVRSFDIPARYGGEEFALILPETTLNAGFSIAERIRNLIQNNTFKYDDFEIKITASLGISKFIPKSNMSCADFINNTDSALYQSKRAGRNKTTIHGINDEGN